MTRRLTRLATFLREEFEERGRQASFCRRADIEPSTVTKWKKHGEPPKFENCLKLAVYFKRDPYEIFDWAERLDYIDLARELGIPGGQPRAIQEEDLYPDPAHSEQHRMLQELIEAGYFQEVKRELEMLHIPRIALAGILRQMAEETQAEASCLFSDGTILFDTGASAQERLQMEREQEVLGWVLVRQRARRGMKDLSLYLKTTDVPAALRVPLTAALRVVAAGLCALSDNR